MAPTPTVNYAYLRSANTARDREWGAGKLSGTFFGCELGGEVGEGLEEALLLLRFAISTGKAQNHVKKLEREALGLKGSTTTTDALANELADIVICVDLVANYYGIALGDAISRKFNTTSEKLSLSTRLSLSKDI